MYYTNIIISSHAYNPETNFCIIVIWNNTGGIYLLKMKEIELKPNANIFGI